MRPLGRIVTAAIGQAGVNGSALLGFRTSFDVAYSGTSSPATATIKVWNVPSTIVTAAFAGPQPSVMLTAGHFEADTFAPIPALPLFLGDVTDYRMKRNGVDHVLEIEALTAGFAWQRSRFVFTSVAPSSYSALMPAAIAAAGLVPRSVVPGRDVPLPHGAYADEPFRTWMNKAAAATGSRWQVSDGEFVDVWPETLPNAGAFAAVFDPSNIIGEPAVKNQQVEIRGLLNGRLRPGSSFTVVGPVGYGTYIATDVKFIGDSGFESAFYVDLVGKIPGT